MTFQPWKQAFNNLPNQFYSRNKNDTELSSTFSKMKNGDSDIAGQSTPSLSIASNPYELSNDSQHYQVSIASNNSSALSQVETEPPVANKSSLNGTKFSIFSQLLNLNKINAFDNLLLNASLSMDDDDLNGDKRQVMKNLMEQAISDESKQQIAFILEKISLLRPAEKLLLYLKMPGGHCEVDPLKQSQNPLGSRSEISHTINWVRSHLEQDDKVSIPKQEVYEDYVSFCGKINIKPLSTADFGKVMKQVFPDIRPRRLGTRGHSRYCYAAMRKATKLAPPSLPDLSVRSDFLKNTDSEDASWNMIKNWSESMLGAQFETIDDLAKHISQNNLTSASTSKQILQKKLAQRDIKDRKRNNNQSIRRRRKKRRTSTSSSQDNIPEMYNSVKIKQEKETDGSAVENNEDHSENSSDIPMNLSNTEQVRSVKDEQTSSTNACASSQFDGQGDAIRSRLKSKLNAAVNVQIPEPMEQKQAESQLIFCKKVRQAQQMKMAAAANVAGQSMSSQQQLFSNVSQVAVPPNVTTVSSLDESCNKSSTKRKQKREMIQMKKPRDADVRDESVNQDMILPQVEINDMDLKKDDSRDDFILPRERFISICNMDRNALDTYLNNSEENSQDLELLQYFDDDKNRSAETIEEDLGAVNTNVPLLENYQLNYNESNNNNNGGGTSSGGIKCDRQNTDKLMQLRSILEEKYNNSYYNMPSGSESVIKSLLLKNSQQQIAEIALNSSNQQNNFMQNSSMLNATQKHEQLGMNDFSIAGDKGVPQSPNTRRRNFSFVPIPTQTCRVKNLNTNPAFKGSSTASSPFISPRVTPTNRRPVQQPLSIRSPTASLNPKNIPALGASNTAFCRPNQFKIEPVSAPPSPSLAQSFNFSPQAAQQQQNQFQFQSVAQTQGTNYNYPVESRSQSVPPHCTNTNNNNTIFGAYNSYTSACSSVAPTPVPSDYQEFSDTNILDMFNNEQPPPPSAIKMETNDEIISDLLENHLDTSEDDLMQSTLRQNFNSISRSVPNTPLPFPSIASSNSYNNTNSMNTFCPLGKSVPNTPITNNVNPFRYSPELQRTRDFLINGFNNNINHNNNIINGKQLAKSHDVTSIDELDSNLLNNL